MQLLEHQLSNQETNLKKKLTTSLTMNTQMCGTTDTFKNNEKSVSRNNMYIYISKNNTKYDK
jgi:hypothetical protein